MFYDQLTRSEEEEEEGEEAVIHQHLVRRDHSKHSIITLAEGGDQSGVQNEAVSAETRRVSSLGPVFDCHVLVEVTGRLIYTFLNPFAVVC